jgi:hypothetical protein
MLHEEMHPISPLLIPKTAVPICEEFLEDEVAHASDVVAVGYDKKLCVTELARVVVLHVPRRFLCGFGLGEQGNELYDDIGLKTMSWQDEFIESWIDLAMMLAVRIDVSGL